MDSKEKLLRTKVVQDYKEKMVESLSGSFPGLYRDELDEAITWGIVNNYTDNKAKLDNNYTKQVIEGTVLDILNYIDSLQPILTSSGVLYRQHKQADNPLSQMIQGFLVQRKAYKKEMFKYPKGSEMFEKYNLLQLLEKLNANATYGKYDNCRLIIVI